MKTAVCISGKLDSIWNADNLIKHVIEPYRADVFIDTWIPYQNNTIQTGYTEADYVAAGVPVTEMTKLPPPVIQEFADKFKPKMMVLDNFDEIPLNHQIRSLLPKNKQTYTGVISEGTKTENVLFMWYKLWKCNKLRRLYEECNRIRYDRIIRLRFDSSFLSFPVIEPKHKTVYIPEGGDYDGGINDQVAIADSQTMDLYCEMHNEIYRYSYAGVGIHPESMLRKHLEVNRLNVERFECGLHLRGNPISSNPEVTHVLTKMYERSKAFLDPNGSGAIVK